MKVLLINIILLTFLLPAWSQKAKQFEGFIPLVDGDSARVQYDYYETKGKRILQGTYMLQANSSYQHDSLAFEKIAWKGAFNENQKEGDWNYQYQLHRFSLVDIDEFEIKYKLASQYTTLNSHYTNGVPDGRWTFSKSDYKQGAKKNTIEEASLFFMNGYLNESFSYKGNVSPKASSIKGKFDSKGFLHDTWEINYSRDQKTITEIRVYDHGFLLSVTTFSAKGDTLFTKVFSDVVAKLRAIKKGEPVDFKIDSTLHDINFDDGYATSAPEIQLQKDGNELIVKSIQEPLQLDTAFRTNQKRVFGTARFMYPLTERETMDIRITKALLDSIQNDLSSIKNETFLDISHQTSDSLAWSYQLIKNYPTRLKALAELSSFIGSKAYRYKDPIVFFNHHTHFLNAIDSIHYNFDDQQKIKRIQFKTHPITSIAALKQRVLEERVFVMKITRFINTELKSVLQSYQLQKLDTLVLDLKREVEVYYDQVTDSEMKSVLGPLQKRFLTTEFNRMTRSYAASHDFNEKLTIGYELLNFLDDLRTLPKLLEGIYARRDSIEQLYTESRLDPYTFSYVDVKLKKKLYEKAAIELFNKMIDSVTRLTELSAVVKQLNDVEQLQNRLIQLREQNTTLLEKQIKPKTTPEEMKQLLGV